MCMITGGIDVGIRYTKVIIQKENEILAKKQGASGGAKREENVRAIWLEAVREAGLEESDIQAIAATGKGKFNISFADMRKTEVVCLTEAVRMLDPQATMAVNMGADEILVAVLDDAEPAGISEMAQNQKCSAGLGLLIENLTDEFGWKHEELPDRIAHSEEAERISDGCSVFARMDALEALNRGVCRESVMAGVIHAAAVRASSVIRDITFPDSDRIVLCGGLAGNPVFVSELEALVEKQLPVIPDSQYICAIGAAMTARKNNGQNEE